MIGTANSNGHSAANDDARVPARHLAEQILIATVCRRPDLFKELSALISANDFFDPLHRRIWRHLERQQALGDVDPEIAVRELDCVVYVVCELIETKGLHTTYANAVLQAHLVVEARKARDRCEVFEQLAKDLRDGRISSEQSEREVEAAQYDWNRESQSKLQQFPLVTALELATAEFALNYLIEHVLVEGQPCILGGPKKSLKTTLAILLAIHAALGIDLFGKFRIKRRYRVLVASAESGMATIQETALRICESLGVSLAEIDNLVFTSRVPKPNDPSSLAAFRTAVEESGAELLILDPFYRMIDGDGQESIFKMGAVLGKLDDLCQELGATLVLCHHLKTSRLNQYAPAELDDLAYAGCAEFFRQWLLLSRREAYQPGSGHHALWLTIGGSAGHNSLWAIDINEGRADDVGGRIWSLDIKRADEARNDAEQRKEDAKSAKAQQQLEVDSRAVCDLLAKHPNGATKTFLRDRCGVSGRRFPQVIASLYEDGAIVDCEVQVGNKRTPNAGFKLSERGN